MATSGLERALDRLRVVLAPELPDDELLRRFVASRDEAAFATLVRRHGRMILGISRRILGSLHDSEDVFQATFLVLAQKARTVGNGEALASWLYKVAYRISLKARADKDRRRRKETQVDAMPQSYQAAPPLEDWEAVLDEELSRLPEKYRLPVILFDLQGRARKEVEQQLRLRAGTLSSRLARARRMLAERLTRRGVVYSSGALCTASSQAALPAKLVLATTRTALLVAAGELGAISGSVGILMKAGVKAMFIAKLKATVATVILLAALGAGGLVYSSGGGEPTSQAKPASELDKLRRENELLKVNLRVTLEKIEVLENASTGLVGDLDGALELQQGLRLDLELKAREQAARALDEATRARALQEEAARALLSRQAEKARPKTSNKVTPPSLWPSNKQGESLDELVRALKLLQEAKARQDAIPESIEPLLRRTVESLDQTVKQLRELEKKRRSN
jgi:RNA polymerase sigma factor (sigma-70 family)